MPNEKSKGVVLEGHKGAAVEVPFDPSSRWKLAAQALWRGRRGHVVRGKLNGLEFESCIVPRSKRFWVLVDGKVLKSARVSMGDTVEIVLEAPSIPSDREPRAKRSSTSKKRATSRRRSSHAASHHPPTTAK